MAGLLSGGKPGECGPWEIAEHGVHGEGQRRPGEDPQPGVRQREAETDREEAEIPGHGQIREEGQESDI
jgi:hypothetical protein